ncbi:arthropod cardioacceleratory peptide 2a [Holotrichia oblita]|uniref:Arthropod cardioacceleratory peptide 2a n=1 Tax=Holotrichia oblita TaxID=644536 RepID=A0ACB9TPZ2_HOLOL|nr:arthropod cardioacceleratory peptide 2a [Holotrichia oblita]
MQVKQEVLEQRQENIADVKKLIYNKIEFRPAKCMFEKNLPPYCNGYVAGIILFQQHIIQPIRKHVMCCQYVRENNYDKDNDNEPAGQYAAKYPAFKSYHQISCYFSSCSSSSAIERFNRNRLNPRINYHHKSTAYDDTVADPLELNAEPGIEDLSRHILSEAQLHQALIELRKEQEAMDDPELMQGVRNMPNNCAVPPCYIA